LNHLFIDFNEINIPVLIGILASFLHVWTGPDHLAAVTPLVFDSKKGHWKIGTFWGIGHLMGMFLIGVLFYLFKDFIPVDSISIYSEQIVGIILIGLGIWSFYRIKWDHVHHHTHPHVHSTEFNDFVHVHEHQYHDHTHPQKVEQSLWTAWSVGIIHGFAGISHFLLMLPALAFQSKWETFQYLVGFAIGTVSAMVLFSIIIGKFHYLHPNHHQHNVFKNLKFWGGLVAIVVGVFWIIKNFF
jgi:ABC-type nickel/cobalt efflux system permease component RcnA